MATPTDPAGIKIPEQPPLYEVHTGKALGPVPPEQIAALIASGKYAFPKGTEIPVLNPQGEAGTIPAEQAHAAFKSGFQYEPHASQRARALQAQYGGPLEQVKTFAESAADAATFGGARHLENSLLDNQQAQAGRVEANPHTVLAGSFTGVGVPMMMGDALPGLNAVKGVSELGKAVGMGAEATAAGALGKVGGEGLMAGLGRAAATKAVGRGVQGAVEGGIYGAGHAVSEAALGDPDFTAEAAGHHILMGALLGGGTGALLGPILPKMKETPLPVPEGTPGTYEVAKTVGNLGGGALAAGALLGGHPLAGGLVGAGWLAKNAGSLYRAYQELPKAASMLEKFSDIRTKVTQELSNAVGSVVRGADTGVAVAVNEASKYDAAKARDEFSKRVENVQWLANNPERLQDVLAQQVAGFSDHLPQTAQSSQILGARAISFLASKVPQAQQSGPLAPKWQPSATEISNFNKYYDAVSKPLDILAMAKAGTLNPQSVEAVKTVYPSLFTEMQKSALDKLTDNKGAAVPYRSRMFLSMLLGQDMDGTLNPDAVGALQATFNNKTGMGAAPPVAPKPKAPRAKTAAAGKMTLASRFTPGSELTGMKRLG